MSEAFLLLQSSGMALAIPLARVQRVLDVEETFVSEVDGVRGVMLEGQFFPGLTLKSSLSIQLAQQGCILLKTQQGRSQGAFFFEELRGIWRGETQGFKSRFRSMTQGVVDGGIITPNGFCAVPDLDQLSVLRMACHPNLMN